MSKVREFDMSDWECFGGAEEFPGAEQPLIREGDNYVAIGDPTGIQILMRETDEEDNSILYHLPTKDRNHKMEREMCRAILSAFQDSLFTQDLSDGGWKLILW